MGVGIGLLTAMVFKSVYLIVFSVKSILQLRPWKLLRNFGVTTIVLVGMAWGGIWLSQYLSIENYFSWALHGVVIVVVMGVVALLVGNIQYPGAMKGFTCTLLGRRGNKKKSRIL